jgi:hypothetical protein
MIHCLVITQAPFEVEESGWGEFETQITIFFADPNEKPVGKSARWNSSRWFSMNKFLLGGILSSFEVVLY